MNKNNRRSIRLQGYDYSLEGAYYVTICVQDRLCLFGIVQEGDMVLNDAGKSIEHWIWEIPNKFKNIKIGEYVIMPNHIHLIVINHGVGVDLCVNPDNDIRVNPDNDMWIDEGTHIGVPLPTIAQWFKTMSTNEYIRGVKRKGWQPFHGKLWQRNYYEHIIRQGDDYDRIAKYIMANPTNWTQDNLHM